MFTAIHNGDCVALLDALSKGADPRWCIKEDVSALWWCIERSKPGCADAIALLLAHGADPNQVNEYGVSSLMKACHAGQVDVVKQLLEAGGDPSHQSNEGYTVLMSSAANGLAAPAIIELLLETSINIDAQSHAGSTALMILAGRGNEKGVRLLLDAGADACLVDAELRTSAQRVPKDQKHDVVRGILESHQRAGELRHSTIATSHRSNGVRL